jgi:hypothetical protein
MCEAWRCEKHVTNFGREIWRYHLEDVEVDGWMTLKWILKQWSGEKWSGSIWLGSDEIRLFVNQLMDRQFPPVKLDEIFN